MKLAYMELKIALVKLIQDFIILPSENTPDKLEFTEPLSVRAPKNGVKCIFKKRKLNTV